MQLQQNALGSLVEDASPAVRYSINQEAQGKLPDGMNWAGWLRRQYCENSGLPEDLWDEIQGEVVRVAQEQLVIDDLLERRGLTQTGGTVATQISQWPNVNDMDQAVQAMNPNAGSEQQAAQPGLNVVPVPYTMVDFQMNIRQMMAGDGDAFSLDTTTAEQATRLVSEKVETTDIDGGDVTVNVGGTNESAPGLTNFSGRVTTTHTDATGSGDLKTIALDMLGLLPDRFDNRPLAFLVSSKYSETLEDDYKAESDDTYRERIQRIDQIEEVEVVPSFDAGEIVLLTLSSDVVDKREIEGMQIVNWEISPFATRFKAFVVRALRLKPQPDGNNTGIVHSTEA